VSSPREYLVRLADTAGALAVRIRDIEMEVQRQAEQICAKMDRHKSADEIRSGVSGLSTSCGALALSLSTLRTAIDDYVSERFQAASPSTVGARSSPVGPVQQESKRLFGLGTEVTGGRSFMKATDPTRRYFAFLQGFPGTRKYALHGNSTLFDVCGNSVDAKKFADVVRQDPDWGNRPITLFSCETGKSPAEGVLPPAQELATELGVEVYAPSEMCWSDLDGNVTISSGIQIYDKHTNEFRLEEKVPADGEWLLFKPAEKKS